jgi:hypothetical protein
LPHQLKGTDEFGKRRNKIVKQIAIAMGIQKQQKFTQYCSTDMSSIH